MPHAASLFFVLITVAGCGKADLQRELNDSRKRVTALEADVALIGEHNRSLEKERDSLLKEVQTYKAAVNEAFEKMSSAQAALEDRRQSEHARLMIKIDEEAQVVATREKARLLLTSGEKDRIDSLAKALEAGDLNGVRFVDVNFIVHGDASLFLETKLLRMIDIKRWEKTDHQIWKASFDAGNEFNLSSYQVAEITADPPAATFLLHIANTLKGGEPLSDSTIVELRTRYSTLNESVAKYIASRKAK